MQQELLQTLRGVRTFGDVVFIVGAAAVAQQVVQGLFFFAGSIKKAALELRGDAARSE